MWTVEFLPGAVKDFKRLSNERKILVMKILKRVQANPLPNTLGGYGKPLGNKKGKNLTNYYKIKLKDSGIRIVYRLIKVDCKMVIIVIGLRNDYDVYDLAFRRVSGHE